MATSYHPSPLYVADSITPSVEWENNRRSIDHSSERRLAAAIIYGIFEEYGNYLERLQNLRGSRWSNPKEAIRLKNKISSIENLVLSPRFLLPYLVGMDHEMMAIGLERVQKVKESRTCI